MNKLINIFAVFICQIIIWYLIFVMKENFYFNPDDWHNDNIEIFQYLVISSLISGVVYLIGKLEK